MKFISKLILLFTFTLSFISKADLLTATLDYNTGKYQLAFNEFQRLAKLGHKDAIYNIGVMFLYGQGVSKNLINAHAWFSLAADYGLDDARSAARLIEQELVGSKEKTELINKLNQLNQEFGYEHYSKTLLPIFNEQQYQLTTNQPPRRVHKVDAIYPKEAYEKGIEGWVWLEFDVDESGAVKDIDVIDAFPNKTFNRAIKNALRRWRYEPLMQDGKAKSYSSRSLLYHFTTFKGKRYQASFKQQKQDYQKKINRLIEGAEQGNALVQYYIANWMVADEHNATRLLRTHWQQKTAGSDLLLASAINGYPNSQYRLGSNLLRGEYTQTDREKGLNWLLNAAQSGFSFAQYRLGRELLAKGTLEYDANKARRWLTSAARQGHFRAQRDLMNIALDAKDYPQAKEYLQLAMKKDDGHPDLLLAQAKIFRQEKQYDRSNKVALKALKQAKSRQWYLEYIAEFIDKSE